MEKTAENVTEFSIYCIRTVSVMLAFFQEFFRGGGLANSRGGGTACVQESQHVCMKCSKMYVMEVCSLICNLTYKQ